MRPPAVANEEDESKGIYKSDTDWVKFMCMFKRKNVLFSKTRNTNLGTGGLKGWVRAVVCCAVSEGLCCR